MSKAYMSNTYKRNCRVYPPPWWLFVQRSPIQESSFKIKAYGIPIRISLSDLTKNWFIEKKFECAAIDWLNPGDDLDTITRIQNKWGLDHIDKVSFAKELSEACKELTKEHKRIEKWIWLKISLLEFIYNPPGALSTPFLASILSLRLDERNVLMSDPEEEPYEKAKNLLQRTLVSASVLANEILNSGKEGSEFWANLMIPFSSEEEYRNTINEIGNIVDIADTENIERNFEVAQELWQVCQPKDLILGIVAETRTPTQNESHIGFWVPVLRTPKTQAPIPGAPYAYFKRVANAVFRDNLPLNLFEEFSPELSARWEIYITSKYSPNLFVSIPFFLNNEITKQPEIYAILNVNIRVEDKNKNDWRRASHEPWLKTLRDQVAPFICEAYLAYKILVDVSFDE